MRHLTLIIFIFSYLIGHAQYKTYHGDGPDDVLRFVPLASTVALKALGVQSRDSWGQLAVNGGLSVVVSCAATWSLKGVVHDTRPDGSDADAFPSGHTSIAFAGARILDKEYRHISPWISVGGYAVATYTAVDRVIRNRHHWEDVAAGAAIGFLSTELGYWLGDKLTHRNDNKFAWSIGANQIYFALRF